MTKKSNSVKTEKAINPNGKSVIKAMRKGINAYVGLYGAAYERAQPLLKTAVQSYDEFAKKGERMERTAQIAVKDTREKAEKTFAATKRKVLAVFPTLANDRVEELEAEIARLSKNLKTKTAKKANKTPAKKTTSKKATTPKAA